MGSVHTPNAYNFDHVDFVLVSVSDPSSGSSFVHVTKGGERELLTKLVISPLCQKEKYIPNEVVLRGGRMRTVSLSFTNPDGSEYDFCGARFSLTLVMLCDDTR